MEDADLGFLQFVPCACRHDYVCMLAIMER